MDLLKGWGVFNYQLIDGLYRLVVEVDPGIVVYYRALLPKNVRLNRQKYPPHISVVRETHIPVQSYWNKHNGAAFIFDYSVEIQNNDTYYWLELSSAPQLGSIREEMGLDRSSWYTRPPNGRDCFHITIGNTKPLITTT